MLDWMLPQFFEVAIRKSLPSALAVATGISERTLRKGPPKREATWKKGIAHAREQFELNLLQAGRPSREVHDFLEEIFQGNGSFVTLVNWVRMLTPCPFEQTLKVAAELDDVCRLLHQSCDQDDVQGLSQAFREQILPEYQLWFSEAGEDKLLAESLEIIQNRSQDELRRNVLLSVGGSWAVYKLTACLDVEFFSTYMIDSMNQWGYEPQPVGALLLRRLNPKAKKLGENKYSSRGLVQHPMARLLDLCYCISFQYLKGKWPSLRHVTRTFVAAAGGNLLQGDGTDQPLAKIRSGKRGLTLEEFRDVWISMIRAESSDAPLVPIPWYVIAQLLGGLWAECIMVNPGLYRYWWQHYLDRAKAQGVWFGTAPWPSFLRVA